MRWLLLSVLLVLVCGCVGSPGRESGKDAAETAAGGLYTTTLKTALTVKEAPDSGDTTPKTPSNQTVVLPRGVRDSMFEVDVYEEGVAWEGLTLFPVNSDPENPRVVEVNMLGEVVWEYKLPPDLKKHTNPGFDVEPLENGNILMVLPGKGVFEVNKGGSVAWSLMDERVSHDADRLPNGNTLIAYGNNDGPNDAQAKEVNPDGEVIWSWSAKDHYDTVEYRSIEESGWTHTNAVLRLPSGNTLISLRNFNFIAEVDEDGKIVREVGRDLLQHQHDPEVLSDGNILLADHVEPQGAVELDPESGEIVWQYRINKPAMYPIRDANRLPNGNTLITGVRALVEVTPGGKVAWRLKLKNADFRREEAAGRGFYKAERTRDLSRAT